MIATKPSIFSRNHLLRDAIGQAIYDAMKVDPSIHMFGEGCEVKQHYDAPYILKEFPDRVTTMPIAEDGGVNFCVGTSLLGIKPIFDVIGSDFLFRAMDSIANTAAKLNFMRDEQSTIVIRAEYILGGPTTGQRIESLFVHVPGLRVVVPSTPRDAYGLMRTALATPGVTLLFEDRMIQDDDDWQPEELETGKVGCGFGSSYWCHRGRRGNVTILSYGVMRQVVQRILRKYFFIGDFHAPFEDYKERRPYDRSMLCDLIDLRSLSPIDWSFITTMLERTGKLLVIEPDVQYGGIGAEIVAHFAEVMPHVRVKRLGAPMATIPAAMSLHSKMLPCEEEIVDAIHSINRD